MPIFEKHLRTFKNDTADRVMLLAPRSCYHMRKILDTIIGG